MCLEEDDDLEAEMQVLVQDIEGRRGRRGGGLGQGNLESFSVHSPAEVGPHREPLPSL